MVAGAALVRKTGLFRCNLALTDALLHLSICHAPTFNMWQIKSVITKMNTKNTLKQSWISNFLVLLLAFSNCQTCLTAEESNFTDEQAVEEALTELQRLDSKVDELIDIMNEAVPYGEEPYEFMDDGTYLNGNDAAWLCMNTLFSTLEDMFEIEDALNEYNPMILQFPNGI